MTTPQHPQLTLSFVRSMAEIDSGQWNTLSGAQCPFLCHQWLSLLETSGSVHQGTGWLPVHCLVRREGRLVAAAPLYLKGHGEGEFVYDTLWAEVAGRMGLAYYPKLVAVSPFTPVGVYRFLVDETQGLQNPAGLILEGMHRMRQANDLSGLHVLFAEEPFARTLENLDLRTWLHQGFLWENPGYAAFGDFLSDFRSGQRGNIQGERRSLAAQGVRVEMVEGLQAPQAWFGLMHDYYAATNEKFGPWGCKYLTREFFLGLADPNLARFITFGAAFAPGEATPVALSLFVKGGDTLYGRYWGAARHVPFLHFELCYYAPIAYAIACKLRRFDPGMGGEHKPRRGFRSVFSHSLHFFTDPRMVNVFDINIPQINDMTRDQVNELNAMVPLKTGALRP